MGREVRQRNKQSRPEEEVFSVIEAAEDIFYGGKERRVTVGEPGKTDLVWPKENEIEVDTVVKHEVPVGVIIAFDVFDNPVSGPEKMGRVTIRVGNDVFAWHGLELSSFSKKDEVIDWLSNLLYVNTLFPEGIVFEWGDIETGLE